MIKKTLTYKDYNGNERTEDLFFHLEEPELIDINIHFGGNLEEIVKPLTVENVDDKTKLQNKLKLYEIFKYIFLKAYGEKSEDGRSFLKSDEQALAFSQTKAYGTLLMELVGDEQAMTTFVNGLTA